MRIRDLAGFLMLAVVVWIVVAAMTPQTSAKPHHSTPPTPMQQEPGYQDDSTVTVRPSISTQFINTVWCTYRSPVCGMVHAQALYDDGVQYGIDPAFALAFFLNESTFGTRGEATQSLSLGNLRCISDHRCIDGYAWFDSWEQGFVAWYQLIRTLYVNTWHLTTVDQILVRYAPAADHNAPEHYASVVKAAVYAWRAGKVTLS